MVAMQNDSEEDNQIAFVRPRAKGKKDTKVFVEI